MSTTRIYGKIAFECDGCADVLETHTINFEEALAIMREQEWLTRRDEAADCWRHYCSAGCLPAKKEGKRYGR